MKRWRTYWIVILLASVFQGGCGFHLRGSIDLPVWLDKVAIINHGANRELTTLLKEQLQAYHIHVCDSPSQADYWLIVEEEAYQQQALSISSSTTPRQYQLTYFVSFRLQAPRGNNGIPLTKIVVTRQITINSDRILGSDAEEALTKQEMRRDAANQVLNRISHPG